MRYGLKLKFKGKGQTEWAETVLPQRIESEKHAEAAADDLRSRGAIVEVVKVR